MYFRRKVSSKFRYSKNATKTWKQNRTIFMYSVKLKEKSNFCGLLRISELYYTEADFGVRVVKCALLQFYYMQLFQWFLNIHLPFQEKNEWGKQIDKYYQNMQKS